MCYGEFFFQVSLFLHGIIPLYSNPISLPLCQYSPHQTIILIQQSWSEGGKAHGITAFSWKCFAGNPDFPWLGCSSSCRPGDSVRHSGVSPCFLNRQLMTVHSPCSRNQLTSSVLHRHCTQIHISLQGCHGYTTQNKINF